MMGCKFWGTNQMMSLKFWGTNEITGIFPVEILSCVMGRVICKIGILILGILGICSGVTRIRILILGFLICWAAPALDRPILEIFCSVKWWCGKTQSQEPTAAGSRGRDRCCAALGAVIRCLGHDAALSHIIRYGFRLPNVRSLRLAWLCT